jgi:hypothetical protein
VWPLVLKVEVVEFKVLPLRDHMTLAKRAHC